MEAINDYLSESYYLVLLLMLVDIWGVYMWRDDRLDIYTQSRHRSIDPSFHLVRWTLNHS